MRRFSLLTVAVALLAAGLLLPVAPASAGDTSMTVSSPTVEVGGSVTVSPKGCVGGDDYTYRYARFRLITGTGADAVIADVGQTQDGTGNTLEVPGWVDPDQPAFVAAFCMQDKQGPVDGEWAVVTATVFTYAEVPIDVLPAPGPDPVPFISYSLDRSTAEAGQYITATGTGCPPGGISGLTLFDQADMSGRSGVTALIGEEPGIYRVADQSGAFTVKISLNAYLGLISTIDPAPASVGDHWLSMHCSVESGPGVDAAKTSGRPVRISVSSSNPTDSHRVIFGAEDTLVIRGEGCDGGRTVVIDREGSVGGAGVFADTVSVTPAADGTWTLPIEGNGTDVSLETKARCGDPSGTGFQYVKRYTTNNGDYTEVTAVAPARVKAGEVFTASVKGSCHDPIEVQVVDGSEVLASSDPFRPYDGDPPGPVEVVAPDRNGTFTVVAPCYWAPADSQQIEVYGASSGTAVPATPIPGSPGYTG